MDNSVITDVIAIKDLFNFYKIILLLIGFVLLWGVNSGIRRLSLGLMDKLPAQRLFILQVVTLFGFVWYILGSLVLIGGILQPPKEFLIAIGGSMAVAVGIALKDVVGSIVAGIVLLFDRPFRVGDRVMFDGVYGDILSIGLRSVRMQTLDDNTVTIPNGRFITEIVSSGNAGALDMMVVADFHLALDADLSKAKELVYEVAATSRFVYLNKPITFVIKEVLMEHKTILKLSVKAYVLDVKYEKALLSDIVERCTTLFLEHGIARP
jgi:small-conductance mechanosensitive channel